MSNYDTGSLQRDPTTAEQSVTDTDELQRVSVASGVLVYESRHLGRELIGFEDVDDWGDVADALRARGHGVGAIHHLPELDAEGSA